MRKLDSSTRANIYCDIIYVYRAIRRIVSFHASTLLIFDMLKEISLSALSAFIFCTAAYATASPLQMPPKMFWVFALLGLSLHFFDRWWLWHFRDIFAFSLRRHYFIFALCVIFRCFTALATLVWLSNFDYSHIASQCRQGLMPGAAAKRAYIDIYTWR